MAPLSALLPPAAAQALGQARAAAKASLEGAGLDYATALEAAVLCLAALLAAHAVYSLLRALIPARGRGQHLGKAGAPAILAVGTANPPHCWKIEEYTEKVSQTLRGVTSDEYLDFFIGRHENCGIEERKVVLSHREFSDENLAKPAHEREGTFAGAKDPFNPTAEERHALWAEWAPKLAVQAGAAALKTWGGDRRRVTHVVFHSCTGFKAPGCELDIVDGLGLTGVKRRLGINYMGCFGGFTGMSVAKAFVEADPSAVVLLVCVELCSLHFSLSENRSEFIGNTIFSDGAAGVVIGAGGPGDWAIGTQSTHTLGQDTRHHMQWAPTNHWYFMYLDKGIANSLGKALFMNSKSYMRRACNRSSPKDVEWCVHPGGVKILDVFCDPKFMLNLDSHILRHSYETLRNFGNMSSPTIFFVIKHMMEDKETKDRAFCLGFGPGLTIEVAGLYKIGAEGGAEGSKAAAPAEVGEEESSQA